MALTNVYGVNYLASLVTVPSSKIGQGEHGGRKYIMREKFTFDADTGAAETIYLGRLPAGSMVLNCRVYGPDMGGTGTFTVGNSASVDGSAEDAALVTSFIAAGDWSGAAFDINDSQASARGGAIGITRFSKEVDVILSNTGVTSGASTKSIYLLLEYIVI